MSKRAYLALALVCLPTLAQALNWKKDCLMAFAEGARGDQKMNRRLESLDRLIARRLQDFTLPAFDRPYYQGYLFWRRGDAAAARNEWFKYLELSARNPRPLPARVEEVSKRLEELRPRDVAAPPPVAPATTPAQKKKSPTKNTSSAVQRRVAPVVPAGALSARAREAYDNGQLEQALRLYRLAKKVEPESQDLAQRIAALENEIGPAVIPE